MPVKKLSVALEADVAAAAARSAKMRGVSLSAWLNEAAGKALRIEDGLADVREFEREHGAFTEEELAWADAVLERRLGHHEAAE